MADMLVPVSLKLPAAVLDELSEAVLASSGPSALRTALSRSAAVKAAVDAFVLNARASTPPAPAATKAPRRFTTTTVSRRFAG